MAGSGISLAEGMKLAVHEDRSCDFKPRPQLNTIVIMVLTL